VKWKNHPARKSWQTLVILFWTLVAAHVGRYTWVTIYYHATQNRWVKPHWDTILSGPLGQTTWDFTRHFLRDGVQYELAATFAWLMLTNPWSKKMQRPPGKIERFMARIHVPSRAQKNRTSVWQFILSPAMVVIAGIPGFAAVYGLDWLILSIQHGHLHDTTSVHTNASIWTDYLKSNTNKWLPHVAGVAGGLFFGRYVFNKIAIDTMELMAARQLWQRPLKYKFKRNMKDTDYGQKPGIWKPPTYRAMYTTLKERRAAGESVLRPGRGLTVAIFLVMPVLIVVAWRGWYILQYIAPH
jgi:hypothetical protein